MKIFLISFSSLCLCPLVFANPPMKPSYEVGISASYEPNVVSNNSVIRASGHMNIPVDKLNLGIGLETDYSTHSPTDETEYVSKISGYEQTKLNADFSYQATDALNVSLFATKPLHYNEKKFGHQQDSFSYGAGVQWVDSQNFSIQANIAQTDYKEQADGISLGDTLHTGIRFKFGLSPKAQFFLGAVHRKQKASIQNINGLKVKLDKKTSGVGAVFGTEYTFDRDRKHHFNFEMQSGIADLGGYLSTGYRYVF